MAPDHAHLGQALHARRDHIFLRQLVQHERAGHAADIGEREIAEQAGRQDDVRERVPERVPSAPCMSGVDQHDAGDRRVRCSRIGRRRCGPDPRPSRAWRRTAAGPSGRARRSAPNSRPGRARARSGRSRLPRLTAARTPSGMPMRVPIRVPRVASSNVAGKMLPDVRHHRIGGEHRIAEIAGRGFLHVDHELLDERPIEAEFLRARAHRHAAGARSPTMASTGSIGTTRPMKNVTATRPRSVVASTKRNLIVRVSKKRRAPKCPPPRVIVAEVIEVLVLLGLA